MQNPVFKALLVCILIVPYSCSTSGTHDDTLLSSTFTDLSVDTTAQVKNVSDIATSIEYIPLQTNNANLIGKADKVDLFGNLLFVLDKKMSKALFVFDKGGNFRYKRKANEGALSRIESISDFSIDKKRNLLYIYSSDDKQILEFALPGGEYLRRFRIKGYFSDISCVDSGRLVLLRDGLTKYDDKYGNDRVLLLDSNGTLLKSWMDRSLNKLVDAGKIIKEQSPMTNNLLVCRMFSDTIYSLSNSKLEAKYKLPLGSDFSSVPDDKSLVSFMQNYSSAYATGNNIFNTNKHLGIYMRKENLACLLLYDKIKQNGTVIKVFNNDLDKIALPMIMYMDDSCFMGLIEPIQLQQQHELYSTVPDFNNKYEQLIKLKNMVTLRSNPVLMIATLK